ncbi:protein CD300H-like isoform X2 [Ovis canadensis]|uniref:protein CD300H-like isoform X2 n=1 Tax=Ovis canadensis TaxID=37174 RepID=UPI0037503B23
MTPRGRAGWLPSALLLLQLPGCLSLSGPSRVTGIVGGSLSVECQYQEVFINNSKYWCKPPCLLSVEMMKTRESEREVRRGRVSIRDRPANLTFTVTLESLREEDAGSPCYSHQHREVHRLPRLSHDPASAHLEHRVWSGDSRSQPTSSVLLRAWCSAVDAGKTTQAGSSSDESCAVRRKSPLDQSTQSSYVNMAVCREYYREIPATGVW